MSIIYDALKKVEVTSVQNAKLNTSKWSKRNFKIYFVYILIACVGAIAASIFFSFLSKPLQAVYPDKANKAVNVAENKTSVEVAPEFLPLKESSVSAGIQQPHDQPKLPTFQLTGIFFTEDEGYALINNRILKEGDAVETATVKKITMDEVELDLKGSSIKLTTNK